MDNISILLFLFLELGLLKKKTVSIRGSRVPKLNATVVTVIHPSKMVHLVKP